MMHWIKTQTWTFIIFYLNSLQQHGSAYRDRTNDIMRLNIPLPRNQPPHINTNTMCGNTEGLTKTQYELCKQDPNAVLSAIQGMQIAVHECKRQFKNNRWNCTALETKNKIPYTSAFFKTGYREAAFAHAISSAGVAHAVAHACALGKIEECECVLSQSTYIKEISASLHKNVMRNIRNGGNISDLDPRLRQYIWGGCDHNINFGITYSKKFLDERKHNTDFQARIMLHNNRVGRLIVGNNMKRRCNCHGTSGACSLQTCWKQTPGIEFIGAQLKDLYFKAAKIELTNKADNSNFEFSLQRHHRHMDNNIHYGDPPDFSNDYSHDFGVGINNLVYYKDSPEYCEADKSISFAGTRGRYCNRTEKSESDGSCSNLCCNRGHRNYRQTRVEKCHCRFHWCCYVNCDTCNITERISVCR